MAFLNSLFRKTFLLVGAASLLMLHACSKKDDTTPTMGGISGTLSPVDGATSVVVSDQSNNALATTVPDAKTGAFSFSNLKASGYFVKFTAGRGYVTPADKSVTVVGGQTTDLGTVKIQGDGTAHGVITWRMNGVTYRATNLSGLIAGNANTIGISARIDNGSIVDLFNISFKNNNYQPGTYVVTRNVTDPYAFGAAFARFDGYTTLFDYGTSYVPSSATISGTLNLTVFDTTAKTLRGDFTFVSPLRGGSGPPSASIEGSFDIYY